MSYIKFHPISETHGYAVERTRSGYQIIYVRRTKDKDGLQVLVKEATSYSNGKIHSYPSPFVADHVIRTEILPLYRSAA